MYFERCIADMWYWRWLLILLNFAGMFCVCLSAINTDYKVKEGKLINDWLFYQQYHFANGCSQGRKMEHKMFLRMIE